MDAATQMAADGLNAFGMIGTVLWTMLRIGAVAMAMPMIGTRAVPGRVRVMLAGTLAIVPAWAALVLIHAGGDPPGHQGHLWLLAALALVWAADSGAYFAGRHFGKHKLAPRISPNKTWEGLVGGLIAGVAVAVGLGWLAGIDAAHLPGLLVTSVVAVFASVLGDLFESLIKRHAGAKDSGHLIPGHGGVLDRVDGVLAAIPVFALGKEIFGF